MTRNDEYWSHQLPSMRQFTNQGPSDAQGAPVPAMPGAGQPVQGGELQAEAASQAEAAPQAESELRDEVAFQVKDVSPTEVAPEVYDAPQMETASQMEAAPEMEAAPQMEGAPQPQEQAAPQPQEPAAPAQPQPQAQAPVQPRQFAQAAPAQPAQAQQSYVPPAAPRPIPPAYASASQFQAESVQQKGGHGWIVAIVVVVCLCALMAFSLKTCTDSMSSISNFPVNGSTSVSDLDKNAIAILELDGTIQYDGSACSPEGLKKLLDEAQKNEYVKALVVRVNSGGGTATAGEEMAEYLRQFDKPVVVSSASINASAAYEISAQADYIYVAKSTEIGAIGTVMQVTDLSGLFEKLGIRMETIASADSKDSSYGYRSLTDEEREYYQRMIDQINDMFIENVAEGRHMDVEKVRELATGLVFTGVDAVENGLADEVGTREDAIKKAAELAGITDYTTADLSFTSYDLSGLAYLLGNDSSRTDELIELLRNLDKAEVAR